MNTAAGSVTTPVIATRSAIQGARIYNGIADGQLTMSQAGTLEQGEAQAKQTVSDAKATDGYVPASVRASTRQQLDALNQSIYQARNG